MKVPKTLPSFQGEKILDIQNSPHRLGTMLGNGFFPKIIWMYWEDINIPSYIQQIVDHIKRLNKDFEIIMLNRDNLKDYLPDFSLKGEMPIANKTDIIRLNLLYEYGGVWIDSTTIFNENLSWVVNLFDEKDYDIVGYYKDTSTIDLNYPIIESWFLASKPKNMIVKKWLDELRPLGNLGSTLYFEKLKGRADYNEIKQNIGRPEYLLIYLAQQIVLREDNSFNLYLKKSEDSAFLVQESRGWSNYEINYALCRLPVSLPLIPIVKLTSGDRILINEFINYNLVLRDSIIGSMIYYKMD